MRAWLLLAILTACGPDGSDDDVLPPEDTGVPDDTGDVDTGDTDEPDTGVDTDDPDTGDTDTGTDTDRPSGPAFREHAESVGLTHTQYDLPDPWRTDCINIEVHGGGGAVGDYDGDGYDDIFLAVYEGRSRLYRNNGDGTFMDVSRILPIRDGFPTGGTWADIDSDGDLDLLVPYVSGGWVDVWINNGRRGFTEESELRGLVPPLPSWEQCPLNWSVALADPDVDGDLDVVVGAWGLELPEAEPTTSRIFRNDGGGFFTDVTRQTGLVWASPGEVLWTFSPMWGDLDHDGDLDLAMTSDFLSNHIMRNDGDWTYTPVAEDAGVHTVENAMGAQIVDLDHDGDLDWIITSIHDERDGFDDMWGKTGNKVYLNDGAGTFTDVSVAWGLDDADWGWGVAAFDADNDGDLDVGWTNGYTQGPGAEYIVEPFLDDPTQLYLNEGTPSAPVFMEQAVQLGIEHDGQGRGFVPFDADRDGDLDLLVIGLGEIPHLWENRHLAWDQRWLTVKVRAASGNTFGIGTTVEIRATPDSDPVRREIQANPNYASGLPPEAHFGLGDHAGPIHEVILRWPYGEDIVLSEVETDQVLVIDIP